MLLYYGLIILAVGVAAQISLAVIQGLTSPLRSIPGPFWARFTRLWYFFRVAQGGFEKDNIALHRRYGPIVRIAPNMYSIDIPGAPVKQIYGINSKMPKSEWYEGWKHPSPDRWTLFPDRNTKRHGETRRRFQGLYSMSSLVSYESYVDSCTDILEQRLREFAHSGSTVDMMRWLQCYAFDVIGEITYSRRFGFLDAGKDVAGLLEALSKNMAYSTLVGIYPRLHKFLFAIMSWLSVGGAAGRAYLMKFVDERLSQRKTERKQDAVKPVFTPDENAPQDFTEKLLVQNEQDPTKVTAYHVFMMGLSNIIAGSDTTAISLAAIMYHLIRTPAAMAKLRGEIDAFAADGQFGNGHLSFQSSRDMPYLQAVIKEALRLHAATGLPLWRDVADGGMEIGGVYFPEGTTVGLNTWCAHYNEKVFGFDAGEFRPERWLEAEADADGRRLEEMNAYYLPVSFALTLECLTNENWTRLLIISGW